MRGELLRGDRRGGRQSRQLARQMARANPPGSWSSPAAMPRSKARPCRQLPNVTLVVGNDAKDDLLAVIGRELGDQRPFGVGMSTLNLNPNRQPCRTRAFIKVQDGCRNRCSFCVVTLARGDERSRPVAEVVARSLRCTLRVTRKRC